MEETEEAWKKMAWRTGIVEGVILGEAESAGSGVALIEYRKPTLLRWNSFLTRQTGRIYCRNIADRNSECNLIERTFNFDYLFVYLIHAREIPVRTRVIACYNICRIIICDILCDYAQRR